MVNQDVFAPTLEGKEWPMGVHYLTWFGPGTAPGRPWAEYKLWTAEWYLNTLRELFHATRDLDRYLGVEMALDGILGATSSAFDAAIGATIMAIEHKRGVQEADRTPTWRRTWKRAKRLADRQPPIRLSARADVDIAMAGEMDAEPTGWLAQLRRLRNRSTHEDTLARHLRRGGPNEETQIIVPGRGAVDPIPYLEEALSSCQDLVFQILTEVDLLRS
jgi:hypothetical protein